MPTLPVWKMRGTCPHHGMSGQGLDVSCSSLCPSTGTNLGPWWDGDLEGGHPPSLVPSPPGHPPMPLKWDAGWIFIINPNSRSKLKHKLVSAVKRWDWPFFSFQISTSVTVLGPERVMLVVKNLPVNARDTSSIPGLGRSPGGGHRNSLQCSCLENLHGQRSLAGYSPYGSQRVGHDWSDLARLARKSKIWTDISHFLVMLVGGPLSASFQPRKSEQTHSSGFVGPVYPVVF